MKYLDNSRQLCVLTQELPQPADLEEPENDNNEAIVLDTLSKNSNTASNAMKYVEQASGSQKDVDDLVQCANRLITKLKEDYEFEFEEITSNQLLNILFLKFEEDRVNLKKAAILAVQALFPLFSTEQNIEVYAKKLAMKCCDFAVAVRKHAAQALTRILQQAPQNDKLSSTWLHHVMHLIIDREPSVQLFASKLIYEILLDPIQKNTDEHCWRLLSEIEIRSDLRRLLMRSLSFLHNEQKIPTRLITSLFDKSSIPDYTNVCWMLLSGIGSFLDLSTYTNIGSIVQKYLELDLSEPDQLVMYISKLISCFTKKLSGAQRTSLRRHISQYLYDCRIDPSSLSSVYYLFAQILDGVSIDSPGYAELTQFNLKWVAHCLQDLDELLYLDAPLSQETILAKGTKTVQSSLHHYGFLSKSQNNDVQKIIRFLSSIGECVQYRPSLMCRELFKLIQIIIPSDVLMKVHEQQVSAVPTPYPLSQNTSLNAEQPPIPSQNPSEGGSAFHVRIKHRSVRTEILTRSVRAHAVLVLGKLCLQDEPLAKKCIPVFVRELRENDDHIVRNNTVVAVCDLCIRYTSMVDRYSTILASCLKDNSVLVRKHALLLLTNLVKEQYLKWEGAIIFRYVTTLLDPDDGIKEYAKFCLSEVLLPQFKEGIFFHRFLECIFIYNGIRHDAWDENEGDFQFAAEVNQHFLLEGRRNFNSRMELYKYMINTFDDQQKVRILEKIGWDIFLPVSEGAYHLNDMKIRSLLYDSLKIMRSKEMRLSMQLGKRDVDYEGDEEDAPEFIQAAAKKILHTTFRKKIAELVMPKLLVLRSYLFEKRSLLLKECYEVILDICRQHSEQFEEFLASDPQLKSEVRFDLSRKNQERDLPNEIN